MTAEPILSKRPVLRFTVTLFFLLSLFSPYIFLILTYSTEGSASTVKQSTPVETIIKELKRKASENVKNQSNLQPSASISSPAIVPALSAVSTVPVPNQTCQITLANTVQVKFYNLGKLR